MKGYLVTLLSLSHNFFKAFPHLGLHITGGDSAIYEQLPSHLQAFNINKNP